MCTPRSVNTTLPIDWTCVYINTVVVLTSVTVITLVTLAGTALWSRQYLINKNQRSNSFLCNYRQYFINKCSILSRFTQYDRSYSHNKSSNCNAYCYICRNLLNISSGVVILADDVLAAFRPVLRLLKCQVLSSSSLWTLYRIRLYNHV